MFMIYFKALAKTLGMAVIGALVMLVIVVGIIGSIWLIDHYPAYIIGLFVILIFFSFVDSEYQRMKFEKKRKHYEKIGN